MLLCACTLQRQSCSRGCFCVVFVDITSISKLARSVGCLAHAAAGADPRWWAGWDFFRHSYEISMACIAPVSDTFNHAWASALVSTALQVSYHPQSACCRSACTELTLPLNQCTGTSRYAFLRVSYESGRTCYLACISLWVSPPVPDPRQINLLGSGTTAQHSAIVTNSSTIAIFVSVSKY